VTQLALDRISKSYGATAAVAQLSLDVAAGECIALLGPSGCGKTTTLRMVAGFITPDAGSIRLAGRDITRSPPHRRRIGMVFQAYALFPHMSAAGNVGFGLEMQGVARPERERRVAAALEMVGLSAMAARYPAQLSGGQQQRVALARALVIEPELLLLDEPLSNLDAGLRAEMREEIAALRARTGVTTLFVTHDQHEAMALADRIALMDRGRIVEIAAPRAMSEAPAHVFTARFLGERTVLAGRVDGSLFRFGSGFAQRGPGSPEGAAHIVLRAARLRLAATEDGTLPLDIPARVLRATWLDDHIAYRVLAAEREIAVIRPSNEPAHAPGATLRLQAGHDALAFLADAPAHEGATP
jgi:putative spermidine/putrescine transport system ATP-binding protein